MPWADRCRRSSGMEPLDDKYLARPNDMTGVCQQVIAHLAVRTANPDARTILTAVDRALPHLGHNEGRAHRQNIAGGVRTYFDRLLPAGDWRFYGHDVHLGRRRVELLWRDSAGRLLIDEVKTGHHAFFATSPNFAHGRRLVHQARDLYGPGLLGLRLLCLSNPRGSLFFRDGYAPPSLLGDAAASWAGTTSAPESVAGPGPV